MTRAAALSRILLAGLLATGAVTAAQPAAVAPTWSFAPAVAASPTGDASGGAIAGAAPVASPAGGTEPTLDGDGDFDGDVVAGIDNDDDGIDPMGFAASSTATMQVYTHTPSVLPGTSVRLHTSTSGHSYSVKIVRDGYPEKVVYSKSGFTGHDYRSRQTITRSTNTTRSNWPISVTVPAKGWRTGVYTVTTRDNLGHVGKDVFVVRDAKPSRAKAMFVLPIMTYLAYNPVGGSLYSKGSARATVVSFDRPDTRASGLATYPLYDQPLLRWLERSGYRMTYTTDYDLAKARPATPPAVMILPSHTEYVNRALFDWTSEHVNTIGDMNVASFGGNAYYWQIRLRADPRGGSRPDDVICYKSASDPFAKIHPLLTTVRFKDAPVSTPEAAVFGGSYTAVVAPGMGRRDAVVTDAAPDWLLEGTGITPGTDLTGLFSGETDAVEPEFGCVAFMTGTWTGTRPDGTVGPITGSSIYRVSPAGAKVFEAGSFGWGRIAYGGWAVGVSQAAFARLTRNLLSSMGFEPGS